MSGHLEDSSFLYGVNSTFIEELYARYLDDPRAVDDSWQRLFGELADDATAIVKLAHGPSWAPRMPKHINGGVGMFADTAETAVKAKGANGHAAEAAGRDAVKQAVMDSIRALMLVRAYRARGHLEADLDPLRLHKQVSHPELYPETFGFTEADYDRPIYLNFVLGLEWATLREIHEILRETYCGKVGVEFTHIQGPDEKAWLQERIEGAQNKTEFSHRGKRAIFERLVEADGFEKFLHVKYTGTKRFGLDGGESIIPALEQVLKRGGQLGVEEVVIGMAHRGRLNVLANLMGKPYRAMFSEFQGLSYLPDDVQGSGDVKYHLGTSADREFDGTTIHLSLTANPSHLEAVNTVVLGKVRAKQAQRGDVEREKVVPLLLHGDAAFAGQGLVAETLDLSELKGYRVGGCIHFIHNNQIGFTTSPTYARSGPYCSEVAKIVQAPIFHVNGDDPEAVVHVTRIATEYRQQFKKDVVIDMFCYRRYGHNEGDEPMFTQPLMYKAISDHPPVKDVYARKLIAEGEIGEEEVKRIEDEFHAKLEDDFEASASYKPNKADWLEGAWKGLEKASGDERRGETAVELDTLREVGRALVTPPEGFKVNSKIARQLKAKAKMFESGEGFDWATAEALAFGTLAIEGTRIRLSGQDSGRGTFSHRHSVLIDQETEERFVPLASIRPDQAAVEIIDSPLSEAGVLGFEYGFSMAEPNALVLWEAQFGDFANGAQVIIDQFISSAESKWLRMSGLVMLLPHGYEGQGPEHSSARLERYLQLCGEDNMQVVNITSPANYFHALRRQIRRNFRKPLIVMAPKSLLRHKLVVSKLEEFGPGASFHRVLWDLREPKDETKVRRVVLCSGKVYYDLHEEAEKRGVDDVQILRLEQLYPFPRKSLAAELGRFPNVEQVVWCQEEPENMGAWHYVDRRIEAVLIEMDIGPKRPVYIGRPEAASPATGSLKKHIKEQETLVDSALSID